MTAGDSHRHETEADDATYRPGADGALDWQFTHEDPVEVYETTVEHRDTEENRERYTPKPGWTYVATDSARVYLGDGTTWNHMGHVADLPTDLVSGAAHADGDAIDA